MAGSDRGRDGSIVTEAPQMLHDLNASVKTPAVDRTENTEILEETELEEENHASLLAGARAESERTGDKLDPILGRDSKHSGQRGRQKGARPGRRRSAACSGNASKRRGSCTCRLKWRTILRA